jgi:hypothetical protein
VLNYGSAGLGSTRSHQAHGAIGPPTADAPVFSLRQSIAPAGQGIHAPLNRLLAPEQTFESRWIADPSRGK